ncbi:MAG TPA: hypothetical protein VK196_13220 [Magnetospirillum sp.]|nr:hypothetical protein [Magnetospirillum sp.]
MRAVRAALLGALVILVGHSADAQAQGKPPVAFVEGSPTCAQLTDIYDRVHALSKNKGPFDEMTFKLFGAYARMAGYVAGYASRVQIEKGSVAPIKSSEEAMELFYNGCSRTPDATLHQTVVAFFADTMNASTGSAVKAQAAGGEELPKCSDSRVAAQVRQVVEQELRKAGASLTHETVRPVIDATSALKEGSSEDALGFRKGIAEPMGKDFPTLTDPRLFRVCEARTDGHLTEKEKADSYAMQKRIGINVPNRLMVLLVQNPRSPREYGGFVSGYLGNKWADFGTDFIRGLK